MYIISFILILFGLFLIARRLVEATYLFLFLIFRSRTAAMTIITILMFPGTVIHELSHLFTATVLGVHAGRLELAPESIREERVTMGSVSIGHTDPLRRYLIGLAPISTGIIVLSALSTLFWPIVSQYPYDQTAILLIMLLSYLMIVVSVTMFSSPEDVKGLHWFLIAFAIVALTLYILGLRLDISGFQLPDIINNMLKTFTYSVGLVFLADCLLYVLTSLITTFAERMLGVKITKHS